MPQKLKYKCLNQNCSIVMFVAMSNEILCPKCSSIKVETLGDTTFDLGYSQSSVPGVHYSDSHAKQSDVSLRRVADRYGLTDMNNRDGQAVKRKPVTAPTGPTTNVGGYQVPLMDAVSGACTRLPMTVPLKAKVSAPNVNKSPMLKGMTNVVASHQGKS